MRFQSEPRPKCPNSLYEYRGGYTNSLLEADKHFLHYSNAVYMGGVTSFKRNGHGILLLDDGTSAVTNYCFDTLIGHNILFKEHAVISLLFVKNSQYELAYKIDGLIILIPYYEQEDKPNGAGVLIDFQRQELFHLTYRHGAIVRKIAETNKALLSSVFVGNTLREVMDLRHEKAFDFSFTTHNGIKIVMDKELLQVGFCDGKGRMDGLGFQFKISSEYFLLDHPYELTDVERGLYSKSKLDGYGSVRFENGNSYIGDFSEGEFDGFGILVYPQQLKWVHGEFEGGSLRRMISMNTGQETRESVSKLKEALRELHQYHSEQWIDSEIKLKSWVACQEQLDKALKLEFTGVAREKEQEKKDEYERLKSIQQFFSVGSSPSLVDSYMLEQQQKNSEKPIQIAVNSRGAGSKKQMIEIETSKMQVQWNKSNRLEKTFCSSRESTPRSSTSYLRRQFSYLE